MSVPKIVTKTSSSEITDEEWAQLSPQEQIELVELLESLVGGESLEQWINRSFPGELLPRHLYPIVDAIEQARVKPIRLCISYGPGHAKTTTLLRALIWWLFRSPKDLCFYVTYSAQAAHDKSRIARDYAIETGLPLKSDSKAIGHWLTEHGGGFYASGARGAIMGKRAPGLFVIDDPYKDELEARSAAINHQVIERFKASFTRLQGGSMLIQHTRWAENDLIGFVIKELGWDYINIPSICDELPDALGRRLDEVAWPEKYPYEICTVPCGHDGHLLEIRKNIGEHLFAALYQGRPRPLGTAVFHEPARYELSKFDWTGKRGVIVVDPAITAKTASDWSAILTLACEGYGSQTRMWITDAIRLQVEMPELVKRIRRLQLLRKLMVAVEAVAGFKGVPQTLRSMDPVEVVNGKQVHLGKLRVLDINPGTKDKFARAQPVAAAWNDGRVMVPNDAPWAEEMIERFQRFTGVGDKEDDEIDAAAHGFNLLYRAQKPEEKRMYDGGGL